MRLQQRNRSMAGGAGICYGLGSGRRSPLRMADFFRTSLAAADPDLSAAIGGELDAAARPDRTDRLGEHRLARRAGGAGLGADQQICRGLSGAALLRRLRMGGPGGAPRHRAGEAAVRRGLCQCPAAFGRTGQPGGLHGALPAGRHRARHVACRRRPPDPRRGAQPVRQVVRRGAIRRAPPGQPDRLR